MNLLASYNWLKEFVDLKGITPEEFASRISLSGPGVEKIHNMAESLDGVVVGEILEFHKHPDADKLHVSKVDIGHGKIIQVIFGQMVTMHVGAKVPVAVAPTILPGGKKIEKTKLRGEPSEGMLCLDQEMGLLKEGVSLQFFDKKIKNGTPIVQALELDDAILDVEVTTNRPDAMSIIGLAREAAAILKRKFLCKGASKISGGARHAVPVRVEVKDKTLCPRFMLVQIDGVKVGPSPWWIKRRLLSAGVRPINNVVDITNYVTLELGQPMHVYDAKKLQSELAVRRARAGERMQALDGKEYQLDDTMLIVADGSGPVDIVGVMGGEATGVTKDSVSILFEAATVDPVSIRRTARKLNLYSSAQALFEKGLSTEAPPLAVARAIELCLELAGGQVASKIFDSQVKKYQPKKFSIKTSEVNALIGVELPVKEMVSTLQRLGFTLHAKRSTLNATIPWWRDHDIESGRDLVEEIARVHGYANLPIVFPAGLATRDRDPELVWEERTRHIAKGAGLTEVYTYSFVSHELMAKAGYESKNMLRLANPLTSDFEFMRTTLLPSLLQVVAENQERFREQKLFEVSHVYYPKKDLPDEQLELGAVFLGDDQAWREAKGFVEHLYRELRIEKEESKIEWKPLTDDEFWHPGRTVQAFLGEHLLGTVGEVHPLIAERFKISAKGGSAFGGEGRVAMIDLPLENVFRLATTVKKYESLPLYPEAKRDLALIVSRELSVQILIQAMRAVSPLLAHVEWFDTYHGEGIPADKKSLAFHLTFLSPERTLGTEEVDQAMAQIKKRVKEKFGGEARTT